MVALALTGCIVGCFYVSRWSRQRRLEIIHEERMAAMEKGIPLPEFPIDPAQQHHPPNPNVLVILGIVLATLSVGTMIVLYMNPPEESHSFWVAPLPFAFLGLGFVAFHFLKIDDWR
jgi:hypothetical protein